MALWPADATSQDVTSSPIDLTASKRMGSSRTGDASNLGSDMSKSTVDVISALAGTMAGRFAEAYDTGEQIYNDTGKITDALLGATKEVVQRTFESPEDIPLIRKGHDRVYRGNDVNKLAAAQRKFLDLVVGPKAITKDTGEDLLDDIAQEIRNSGKNKGYKAFSDEYNKNQKAYEALSASKDITYNQREQEKSKIARLMNKNDQEQSRFLKEVLDDVTKQYGADYEKQYKEKFTFENWGSRLQRAANRARKNEGLDIWREKQEAGEITPPARRY